MDQQRLIELAQRGDHDAFAQLVDATIVRLDASARLILRDRELAQDAVQEALLRAWRDIRGLRDPGRFDAWLYRLTVHACLDLARRRRRRVVEVALDALPLPRSPDPTSDLVRRDLLDQALRSLDPAHRAVVALHYLLDMPLRDVADTMGIPVGTAKSRLHYALKTMRTGVLESTAAATVVPGGQVA